MSRIKNKLNKAVERSKETVASISNDEAPKESVPRITNDTVAEHREEVLSSARKYIYPLQHSRHRIVTISITLFAAVVVAFFTYTVLALYKFHSTSTLMYRVTQVLPFPVAKADSSFVAYENYLFEVRRYIHYYQTQQNVDFGSKSGKDQLADFRKTALDGVINDAYVKRLAREHKISVSRNEVNDQIALLRSQNRLGGNDKVFSDVLKEFWGWSEDDFRRELRQQLLAQKVASKLDTKTHQTAETVLAQLQGGADFAALAKQYSQDDTTKSGGGDYGALIEKSNKDIPAAVMRELFRLQPGQMSGVVETPLGLEILKVAEVTDGRVRASHIMFKYAPVSTYLEPVKKAHPPTKYVSL